ncbi:hypothetical protein PROFUN_08568 [Planoprotostelium fungivorum]|uniref:TraB family protein n=1 Tax=Planoprotostelium fungivorum TaxID=1890364 RepID=A0A2P6N1P2_9EUKA|nr:hypothetical protein PROFUN_08568 [Planoprotostelium fungivorum]
MSNLMFRAIRGPHFHKWPQPARPVRKTNAAQHVSQERFSSTSTEHLSHLTRDGSLIMFKNPFNQADVFVIGTSNASRESTANIQQVIRSVEPNTVFLELDQERMNRLLSHTPLESDESFKSEIFKALSSHPSLKSNPLFGDGFIGRMARQGFEKYIQRALGIMKQFGLVPGEMFRAAIGEARNKNSKVVLGGIDPRITLHSAMAGVKIPDFSNLNPSTLLKDMNIDPDNLRSIMSEAETMETRETARRVREGMKKELPQVYKALFTDREEYMNARLEKCEGKTVAVVGMMHMDAIEEHFKRGKGRLGS